jgi:hypothetical protein
MLRRLLGWPGETLRFLREKPSRLLVILATFVVGGIAGLPFGEDLYQYTWTDSRFCDDCHIHDYANEAWERSVHSELTTCHDCHRVPISHYPHNLWLTVFDRPEQGEIERPAIGKIICEQCHADAGADDVLTGPMSEELRQEIVRIDNSPLHKLHMEAEDRDPGKYRGASDHAGSEGKDATADHSGDHTTPDGDSIEGAITCLDCHGSAEGEAHQFVARTEVCEECHENQVVGGGRAASVSCRDCHFAGFLGTILTEAAAP